MNKLRLTSSIAALALLAGCGIISDDPPSMAQIEAAFASGDLGKTRRMVALAYEAGIKDGQLEMVAADVALARGDGIGAATNLNSARRYGVDQKRIAPKMAEALIIQGKFEDARAAAKDGDDKAITEYINGMEFLSKDRLWHGREALEKAYKITPKNPRLALDLARARTQLGLFPDAREIIKNVQKSQPRNILALLQLGEVEMRAAHYDTASAAFKKVLKIAPGHIKALNGNVRALYNAKNWQGAKKAIIAMPRDIALNPQMQLMAAKISMRLKDFKNARTHFSNARNAIDGDTEAQFLLGSLHLKDGRPYKAINIIEAVVSVRPDMPEHHAELIRAYRAAGDERGAKIRIAKIPESLKTAKELQGL